MKKHNYYLSVVFLLMATLSFAQVQKAQTLQIGNTSTNTQSGSAALQIDDTNRGFLPPRMTTTQRDAIASPVAGLTIFNTTKNCLEWYNGTGWYNGCGDNGISLTSGGTAIVSAWTCSVDSAGTLTYNKLVSGVTQTVKATVVAKGTYDISVTSNGVTFVGSGTFSATGPQNVVLTAIGTPTIGGTLSFALNTTPSCSFDRTVAYSIPSVPENVTAVAGVNKAIVSFTPSTDNGGDAAIKYTVTSNPEVITATGSSSPITVSGLTNGTSYTFTVKATNLAGDSAPSDPTSPATPAPTVPSAPVMTAATFGNGQVSISFDAPTDNGGESILNYTVSTTTGSVSGTTSPIVVSGLTNGETYTFSMIATNIVGNSIASNSLSATPKTIPDAPIFTSINQVTATTATIVLNVANNGGNAINNYTVTSNPGGLITSGQNSTLTVTGLTAGVVYTFDASVTNNVGTSPSTTSTSLKMNKTGNMFTNHKNGVVAGVYTGTQTTITHTNGEAFSNHNLCLTQQISVQNSAADCPSSVTSFDGQNTYSTAYINGQCWIAQNIFDKPVPPNNTTYVTAGQIELNQAGNNTGYDWAGVYVNDLASAGPIGPVDKNIHGFLYQYNAAMNRNLTSRSQGVCPNGWHIPSDCEYRFLAFGLGMSNGSQNIGYVNQKLLSSVYGGNNITGFNGTLSGNVRLSKFQELGTSGFYRVSDSGGTAFAIHLGVISTSGITSNRAHSLRCIKD